MIRLPAHDFHLPLGEPLGERWIVAYPLEKFVVDCDLFLDRSQIHLQQALFV